MGIMDKKNAPSVTGGTVVKEQKGTLLPKLPRLTQIIFFIFLLFLTWSWTTYELINSRHERLVSAEETLRSDVHTLAGYARKILQEIDGQMLAFDKLHASLDHEKLKASDIRPHFIDLARSIEGVHAFGFIGTDGIVKLPVIFRPDGSTLIPKKTIDLSDRPYFLHFSESWAPERKDEMFIGSPVEGKVTGKWSIPIVTPRVRPDGSFDGLIMMSFKVDEFYHLFPELSSRSFSTISFLKLDGTTLAHQPFQSHLIGTPLVTDDEVIARFKDKESEDRFGTGVFYTNAFLDTHERIVAFHDVDEYQLRIILSRTVEKTLVPWRNSILFVLSIGLISTTVLLLLIRTTVTQMRTQNQLLQSEWRYRSVTESATDGIIAINSSGNVISWNAGAEQLFGYTETEIIGQPLTILMPEKFREPHQKGIKRAVENRSVLSDGQTMELQGLRKNGEEFPISLTIGSWQGNEEIFFSGIIHDATERLESERILLQGQKMDALGNLAAGIAHDLNNMLLPIVSLTGMTLKEQPDDSRNHKRLERVLEAANNAGALISEILKFGRQSEINRVEVRMCDVLEESIGLLSSTLPSTIALEKTIIDDGMYVHGDKMQLVTVFLNLASNAADAMKGKVGTLKFELKKVDLRQTFGKQIRGIEDGKYALAIVTDTGCGMNADTLNKIFDPFFTTKEVGQGTGVGLTTTFSIIEKHGGAITATSVEDEGSRFEVYLPIVESLQKTPPE